MAFICRPVRPPCLLASSLLRSSSFPLVSICHVDTNHAYPPSSIPHASSYPLHPYSPTSSSQDPPFLQVLKTIILLARTRNPDRTTFNTYALTMIREASAVQSRTEITQGCWALVLRLYFTEIMTWIEDVQILKGVSI